MTDVVIVGAGLAGIRTAQALRGFGHTGRIRVLSDEAEEPYDRPPLSKEYLLGERSDDAIRLGTTGIEVTLGSRVVGLAPATRTLYLDGGREVGYDRLVVATGARPRRLPGLPESVHYLRTAADSRRLREVITAGRRIVVVGAGFIGLEVASAARLRGCRVTVVEAMPQPLATIIGAEPAAWLQAWHAARGITFHCGTTVRDIDDADLTLADGTTVAADAVVVGVGVVRDVAWLASAGLDTHVGLVCDGGGRTSVPDVFGAGDIVCRHTDGCTPIAHWTAAAESATRTAAGLLGLAPPVLPDDGFFWSNQAELRLQFAGSVSPESVATVAAGTLDSDRFVVHYTTGGMLTGVFAANWPREFLRGRVTLRATAGVPA
jgi:3-phenylpropionate/trans-cinnamate dioxygenase ferredoxin reductase component